MTTLWEHVVVVQPAGQWQDLAGALAAAGEAGFEAVAGGTTVRTSQDGRDEVFAVMKRRVPDTTPCESQHLPNVGADVVTCDQVGPHDRHVADVNGRRHIWHESDAVKVR